MTNNMTVQLSPITATIPTAEIRAGLLSSHTEYLIKLVDFGSTTEIFRRFDDFWKLSDTLRVYSPPALPPKTFFGGNDPKTVEERRPVLEEFVQFCLKHTQMLSDDSDEIYKFLQLPPATSIATKFVLCGDDALTSNLKRFAASAEALTRLSHAQVLSRLLDAVEIGIDGSAEVLAAAFSRGPVRKTFAQIGGFVRVLKTFEKFPGHMNILNAYCTASGEEFPHDFPENDALPIFLEFLKSSDFHVFLGKIIWKGFPPGGYQSPQFLSIAGRLFVSEKFPARVCAAVAISAQAAAGQMDSSRVQKFAENLANFADELRDDPETAEFVPSILKGPAALGRLASCITFADLEISSFVIYLVQVLMRSRSSPPAVALERAGILAALEDFLRNNAPLSSAHEASAARLLLRLRSDGCLPAARTTAPETEAHLREAVIRDCGAVRENVHERMETARTNLSRATEIFGNRDVDLMEIFGKNLEIFHSALSNHAESKSAIRAALNSADLEISSANTITDNTFPEVDKQELGAWAENSIAVLAMEREILSFEEEAVSAEAAAHKFENEAALIDQKIKKSREQQIDLEGTLAEARASGRPAEDISAITDHQKKISEKIAVMEGQLNELRTQAASASGIFSLARKKQADVRARGEASTSRQAVLEISLRSSLGSCHSAWAAASTAAEAAESAGGRAEKILRGCAEGLFPAEAEKRAAVVSASRELREALLSFESRLLALA